MSTFKKIIRIYHEAIDKILSDQTSDDEKDLNYNHLNFHAIFKGNKNIINRLVMFPWGAKYFDDLMALNQRLDQISEMQSTDSSRTKVYDFSSKKININHKDNNGRTPVHLALSRGYPKILEKLLAVNARIDLSDSYRCLPIHYGSSKGNYHQVELLLQKNNQSPDHVFDLNQKNDKSKSSLNLALNGNHKEVIEILIKYGANINEDLLLVDPHGQKIQLAIENLGLDSLIFLTVIHDTKNRETPNNLKVNQSLESLTTDQNKADIEEKISILNSLSVKLNHSGINQIKKLAILKFFSQTENFLKLKDFIEAKKSARESSTSQEGIENPPLPQCLNTEEQKEVTGILNFIANKPRPLTQTLITDVYRSAKKIRLHQAQ